MEGNMKRIIAFITALGMCATTLVGNTALFSPTAYAVTEENAIDLFVENYSMWNELPLLTGGYGAVSFLDIDFDGNLELVAGYMGGSGLFTSLEFYKIDGDNVIKLSAEDDYADYPDIMGNGMSLYRNDHGELAYYGYDSLRSGVFYNSSTFCSFAYNPSSNYVERKNYFSAVYEAQYNPDTQQNDESEWYYDYSRDEKISEAEYEQLKNDTLLSMTDMHLTYKFVDISKLTSNDERKTALSEAYEAFSYSESNTELGESDLKDKLEKYGNLTIWEYHDYDGDGTNEAYGVITESNNGELLLKHVYFVDSYGAITQMPEDFWGSNCYSETEKYSVLNEKGFFSFDMGNGGSGWQTLLYSVKDGTPYELTVSRTLEGFYQRNGKDEYYTFVNDYSTGTHKYVEHDLVYDEKTQQFSIGEESAKNTDRSEKIYGDFKYYVNENYEVVIIQYLGSDETVIIPDRIDDMPVAVLSGVEGPADLEYRRIGAFNDNDSIKKVVIPDSVISIEQYTFMSCDNLEEVQMSENLREIEWYAFFDCGLSYVYLPKSIETIGENALGYKGGSVINEFTIYGFKGTVAETYANENDILFVARNEDNTVIQPLEISIDYIKLSDYSTLPNDDTVRLMGYPVYEISASVKNIDVKDANNVKVKILPSDLMTIIEGDTEQSITTIASQKASICKWKVKFDATSAYSSRFEVDAKADNSVTSKAVKTITFDSDILGYDNRFDFDRDTWWFTNNGTYYSKGHFINDIYQERWFSKLPNTVVQKVRDMLQSDWGGSCYGMSTVAILSKLGIINISDYDSSASCVHNAAAPKDSDAIYSLIESYYVSQCFPQVKQEMAEFEKLDTNEQLHKLVEAVSNVKNGGCPVNLCLFWFVDHDVKIHEYYNDDYDLVGHSIVAYDVVFLNKPAQIKNLITKNKEDYSIKIKIYDCATSGTTPIYMYVTSDYEHWIIPEICGKSYSIQDYREEISRPLEGGRYNTMYYESEGFFNIVDNPEVLNCFDWTDFTSNYHALLTANCKTDLLIKWNNSSYKFRLNQLINGHYDIGNEITAFFSGSNSKENGLLDADVNYVLPSSSGSYTVSAIDGRSSSIAYSLTYDNSMISVEASSAKEVTFNDDSVKVLANNSDYTIGLTFNEGYYNLPWYTVTASGTEANNISMEQTTEGIVLSSDNLKDVTIQANNTSEVAELSFTTDTDNVLIKNNNANLEVYKDSDGNGTYDMLVNTTSQNSSSDTINSNKSSTADTATNTNNAPNTGDDIYHIYFIIIIAASVTFLTRKKTWS